MFGSLSLALRLRHIILGIATVIGVGILSRLPGLWGWSDSAHPLEQASHTAIIGWRQLVAGLANLDASVTTAGLGVLAIELPSKLLAEHPLVTLASLLPVALVWSLGGGAISRSVAIEHADTNRLSMVESLRFSLSHTASMLVALFAPLIMLALLQVLMAALGRLGFANPAPNSIAAWLFFVPMVFSAAFVALAVATSLATHAAIPAVACEATDAIDASQRIFAYVILRPIRFLFYACFLALMVAASAVILMLIAESVVRVVETSVGQWSSPDSQALPFETSGGILGFWLWIPRLIAAGIVVSVYFSGSTLLYLFLRQINDGQHPADLWTQGMIDGTRAARIPKAAAPSDRTENEDEEA